MDAFREQLNKPLTAGIIGLVLGIIIGLVVLGWWLFPVQWTDAIPEDLSGTWKAEYLRMAIEANQASPNPAQAQMRYQALGDSADETLAQVQLNPGNLSAEAVNNFAAVVAPGAVPPGVVVPVQTPPAAAGQTPGVLETLTAPTEAAEEEPAGGGIIRSLLPILCGITLLAAAALFVIYIMRGRAAPGGPPSPAMQAQQAAQQATYTQYSEPPMAQFMASYKLGDDLFDDSFSIDTPAGEFMGECGVGISDTIGVGDPKKVSAFEVWLFDKNDIQTVTKVLMSAHSYQDDATRQRLAAKGEPVLAAPGAETVLETQTLQLIARVIDMGYGEGALPPESFFDRFILELAIWPKA